MIDGYIAKLYILLIFYISLFVFYTLSIIPLYLSNSMSIFLNIYLLLSSIPLSESNKFSFKRQIEDINPLIEHTKHIDRYIERETKECV